MAGSGYKGLSLSSAIKICKTIKRAEIEGQKYRGRDEEAGIHGQEYRGRAEGAGIQGQEYRGRDTGAGMKRQGYRGTGIQGQG